MLLGARMFFEKRGALLPDGATELEYVVSNRAAGINTGLIPSAGTDIFCLAEPVPDGIIVILGDDGAWIGHQSSYNVTSSNGSTNISVSSGALTTYGIVSAKIQVGDTMSKITTAIIGKPGTLCYGAYARNSTTYAWHGKMGRFWAIQNGETIIDLRPCLHKGLYGFCDVISSTFVGEGRYSDGA